jgi:hypothetical protein
MVHTSFELESNACPDSLVDVVNQELGKELEESYLKGGFQVTDYKPSDDGGGSGSDNPPGKAFQETTCVRFFLRGRCKK